jgi:hypothetical protein
MAGEIALRGVEITRCRRSLLIHVRRRETRAF